jgi:hypothetical protein
MVSCEEVIMLVCMTKSGKIIEMQSNATSGTLIKNALLYGYEEKDIIEKEVTEKEWKEIFIPTVKSVPKTTSDILKEVLISKNIITQSDFDSKKVTLK